MRMTYEAWQKLSDEEQENVPDEQLPEIPAEQLENNLTRTVCRRQDGVLGWESTQKVENGFNTKWFPIYHCKNQGDLQIWYKFNPIWGTYEVNSSGLEPSMEEEPIGGYGMKWIHFMEEHYPEKVGWMRLQHKFLTVARSMDKRAWDYREILERDFEKMTPKPTGDDFEERVAWFRAMDFYVDSTVMRERVLVPVTEP